MQFPGYLFEIIAGKPGMQLQLYTELFYYYNFVLHQSVRPFSLS